MLHPSTKILTPDGLVSLNDIEIGQTVSTIYGPAKVQNKTTEFKRLNRLVFDLNDTIFCCHDQKFLIKTSQGYNFKIPEKYDEVACYGLLTELRKIHALDSLSSSNFIRLHLLKNFTLLINGYIVAKT